MQIRQYYAPVLWVVAALAAAWWAGCQGSDLGRFCVVGAEATDTTEEKLNSVAPECEERLCLAQRGYRCADGADRCLDAADRVPLKPMCSVPCTQNADCGGGDVNINGCSKYVCQKAPWGTDYQGCLCACLDYMRDGSGLPLDKAAFNASDAACGL